MLLSLPLGFSNEGEAPAFLAGFWTLAVGIDLIVRRDRIAAD